MLQTSFFYKKIDQEDEVLCLILNMPKLLGENDPCRSLYV
jgi:hypothetical protein